MLAVPTLLVAVSDAAPCGEDLEYDPAYLQLERDAQGQPERAMGNSVLPAEPPKWRDVQQSCLNLLKRSKDLRLTLPLLHSAIAIDGLNGLSEGLQLIQGLLQQYWAEVYPLLDADDDNDPTLRLNALAGLTADGTVKLIREAPLSHSRAFGTVSLRAALNASGLQHFASETLTTEQLSGALRDSDPEATQAAVEALRQAQAAALGIEATITEQLGAGQGIDLSALRQPIRQALQILEQYAPAAEAPSGVTFEEAAADLPAVRSGTSVTPAVPGEVNNRDDVLRSLERILSYYARSEPSSPVPILLTRAKQLVSADFAAIVRNLLPDGLSQFENLRGPENE